MLCRLAEHDRDDRLPTRLAHVKGPAVKVNNDAAATRPRISGLGQRRWGRQGRRRHTAKTGLRALVNHLRLRRDTHARHNRLKDWVEQLDIVTHTDAHRQPRQARLIAQVTLGPPPARFDKAGESPNLDAEKVGLIFVGIKSRRAEAQPAVVNAESHRAFYRNLLDHLYPTGCVLVWCFVRVTAGERRPIARAAIQRHPLVRLPRNGPTRRLTSRVLHSQVALKDQGSLYDGQDDQQQHW